MEFHRVISGRTPVADGPARRYWGPFRALCADNNDPEQIGRIRVECPLVYGPGPHNRSPWAWPKNQVMAGGHRRRIDRATVEVTGDMGSFMIPEEGSPVWVEFENGDPQYPVYSTGHWGGSADGSAGTPPIHPAQTPEESKRTCPEQYPCFGDEPRTCLDCEDALEHAARAYDDVEHGKFHSHASGVFYCPRMRTIAKTETGHSILANDKDGREFMAFVDRTGQCLKFKGRILPELQVGEWSDGSMKGNILPRGMRIMDRKTEWSEYDETAPAEAPVKAAGEIISAAGYTQQSIADALDGLLEPAARAALEGMPLGNVLGMLDGVMVGGAPLTPGKVFSAFVGGVAASARNAVAAAMKAAGTSPQGLLAAITATAGLVDALTGEVSDMLAVAQGILPGVFPTILSPLTSVGTYDGFDPREYCPDQWASVEMRDLARGWIRLETAAVLDAVEIEGASAAPTPEAAATLASLGLTIAELSALADALALPTVRAVLSGTALGTALEAITGLNLNGVPLTPSGILNAFAGNATAAARNAVTSLLATVNLTPLSFVNAISTFSVTTPVLSALRSVPGVGTLASVAVGATGIAALGGVLSAIPGAAAFGSVLGMFGLLGVTSLFGFFPSLGLVIGEKTIVWRSDRDLTRHQSMVIDHTEGQEKVVVSGLNIDGEQVGPQAVWDATLGGRFTVIDPVSGSFENLEMSTGGTKEALYFGGRNVGTDLSDFLTVGGDWLCFVGFPSPLSPRAPIDVLPVLDEKAAIAPQAVGEFVLGGMGNILHAAILTSTRWAGLSIFDFATVNYTRAVGGVDTVEVGGAQFIGVGGAQVIGVGAARTATIGAADIVTVGLTHTVTAGVNIVHNSAMHVINAAATASHYAAVSYDLISAIIHLYGGSTAVSKQTPYCAAVYGPLSVECPLTGIIHPQPSLTVYATA